ncbi:MAG: DUF1573 domain-containing protein [Microscillaceae bacterium]|nr:DUF1573 domain-containing protein [Microscillaceae bacterium]
MPNRKQTVWIALALTFALSIYGTAYTNVAKHLFTKPSAEFGWEKTEHNFGKIPQGKPVKVEFEFRNIGSSPLVISQATGSCGCTVPEWPKQPIPPGQTGVIKAEFNAAALGVFNKTITIESNAQQAILTIKGEVIGK